MKGVSFAGLVSNKEGTGRGQESPHWESGGRRRGSRDWRKGERKQVKRKERNEGREFLFETDQDRKGRDKKVASGDERGDERERETR